MPPVNIDVAAGGKTFLGAGYPHLLDRDPRWRDTSEVKVWSVETGQLLYTLAGHFASFTKNGKNIVVFRHQEVRLHDAESGDLVRVITRIPHFLMATANGYFSPDERTLMCQHPSMISLWDVEHGNVVRTWSMPVVFSPYGETDRAAVYETATRRLKIYDIRNGKEVTSPHESRLCEILRDMELFYLDSSGHYAWARSTTLASGSTYWLVDLDDGTRRSWGPPEWGRTTGWMSWVNGRDSVVPLDNGLVRLYDVFTCEIKAEYRFEEGTWGMQIRLSPDGIFAAVLTNTKKVFLFRLPELTAADI